MSDPSDEKKGIFGTATSKPPGGGLFGNKPTESKGGLFGSDKASGGNLLSEASKPSDSTGGFALGAKKESTQKPGDSKGLFSGSTSSGTGLFGPKNDQPKSSGGLFGGINKEGQDNSKEAEKSKQPGSLFGGKTDDKGAKSSGGFFGSSSTPKDDKKPSTSPFESSTALKKDEKAPGGLFGGTTAKKDDKPGISLLSNKPSGGISLLPNSAPKPEGEKKPAGGLFGQISSKPTGGAFGGNTKPEEKKSTGPFGAKTTNPATTGGSTLFGKPTVSSKETTDKTDKPKPSLFGNDKQKEQSSKKETTTQPAFGKPAEDKKPGSSLFPSKPAEKDAGGMFGKKPQTEEAKGPSKELFQKLKSNDESSKPKFEGFGAKPAEDKKDSTEEKKTSPFGGASASKPSAFGSSKGKLPAFQPGAKKEEDKKEEQKTNPIAKSNNVELIKKATLDDAQKLGLDSSTLEDIFSNWYNKVEGQSKMFKEQAKVLKRDELLLYDNLATLETLNSYSERVIQDYGITLNTMQGLAAQQKTLMDSLEKIDGEIDEAIAKNQQGINTYNRFRGTHFSSDDEMNSKINYRQQMANKANDVNHSLDQIESTIKNIGEVVSNNHEKGSSEDEEEQQIGKVLNQAYDSLRWIQDTAVDLNYQIELLDSELAEL
ncbi:unnamed protein product [Moneuplotes crassus]|uniref:Nucleoporin NSP1-like C-terminal domain-containing protein n=1 Tax=Euplotes crassus TaxID=5936 RepID=A0AAD1U2W6_EUPCR|nr:unnamed protein product [Moneuplotes crassus]